MSEFWPWKVLIINAFLPRNYYYILCAFQYQGSCGRTLLSDTRSYHCNLCAASIYDRSWSHVPALVRLAKRGSIDDVLITGFSLITCARLEHIHPLSGFWRVIMIGRPSDFQLHALPHNKPCNCYQPRQQSMLRGAHTSKATNYAGSDVVKFPYLDKVFFGPTVISISLSQSHLCSYVPWIWAFLPWLIQSRQQTYKTVDFRRRFWFFSTLTGLPWL